MASRTRFSVTISNSYTRYGVAGITLSLYNYQVTINNDYTITGTRALDSVGDPISGVDNQNGQYSFSDVPFGEFTIVAQMAGIVPQVVNGYDRFVVLPKLAGDEIAASETDTRDLKTVINSVISYILQNDSGWVGTPPTVIS